MKNVEVIVIRNPNLIEELEGFTQQKEIYDLDETTTLTYVNGDELGGLIIDTEESDEQRFWFKAKAKVYDVLSDSTISQKIYIRTANTDKAFSILKKMLEYSYPEFEVTSMEKTEAILTW